MLKPNAQPQSIKSSFLLLLSCFIFSAATNGENLVAHTIGQTSANQPVAVAEALRASFGSTVEAVTAFQPYYLTGDFNGDQVQDLLVLVRIKERRSALPQDVRIINPFEFGGKVAFPPNPASGNIRAFVIIHSWKASPAAGKFLLIGEAPILILQYDLAIYGPEGTKDLMDVTKRRAKRRKGETLPPASKGDVINLGSQVGGSVLYWNGRTYRWEDSPDD